MLYVLYGIEDMGLRLFGCGHSRSRRLRGSSIDQHFHGPSPVSTGRLLPDPYPGELHEEFPTTPPNQ